MTTPSNANTSGLEVVAWETRLKPDGEWLPLLPQYVEARQKDDAVEVRPSAVTAASAQARISELERDRAELARIADEWATEAHDRGNKLIATEDRAIDASERAEAAEARADRLADIVKLLDECIWFNPDTQNFEVNHDGSVEKARAALQQEG